MRSVAAHICTSDAEQRAACRAIGNCCSTHSCFDSKLRREVSGACDNRLRRKYDADSVSSGIWQVKQVWLAVGFKAMTDLWYDDAPQDRNASDQQINAEQNAERYCKVNRMQFRSFNLI